MWVLSYGDDNVQSNKPPLPNNVAIFYAMRMVSGKRDMSWWVDVVSCA